MKCLKNSNDSIDNLVVMLMDKNRKQVVGSSPTGTTKYFNYVII